VLLSTKKNFAELLLYRCFNFVYWLLSFIERDVDSSEFENDKPLFNMGGFCEFAPSNAFVGK